MANKQDRPVIPNSAWNPFIETGRIDEDFFMLIAHRMKFQITLTDREQALYIAFPEEIEKRLRKL